MLEDLHVLILDELSMISSDMLYFIDRRLKDLKEFKNDPFGGVSVVLFGDVLQLPPINASAIWRKPSSSNASSLFLSPQDNLWQNFEVNRILHTENFHMDTEISTSI